MRRIIALIMSLTLMVSLCACDSSRIHSDDTATRAPHSDSFEETPTESSVPSASYAITDCRAKTWTSIIGSVRVQTIVEITNTGTTNLYLSSGSYDLEDTLGNLVACETWVSVYPDVLAPGEKGYMYDETSLDEAVDGGLVVLPRVDVARATIDLIRFPVTDVKTSTDTYGGIKMLGRVENTSREIQTDVYIVAFLYDADGSCIGKLSTLILEDLNPGDKIGFEMSGRSLPDDVTVESVADFVVYAYPTQYQF